MFFWIAQFGGVLNQAPEPLEVEFDLVHPLSVRSNESPGCDIFTTVKQSNITQPRYPKKIFWSWELGLHQDLIVLNGAVWWTLHQSSIEAKDCSIEISFGSDIIQYPRFRAIGNLAGDKCHKKLCSLVCREGLILEKQFSMKIEGIVADGDASSHLFARRASMMCQSPKMGVVSHN
jgi:hypothetical protein